MGNSEEESDGDSEIETDVRAVEELVEDVSGDVGIIAETALLAPFEITFGFFSDFGLLVIVASIGSQNNQQNGWWGSESWFSFRRCGWTGVV